MKAENRITKQDGLLALLLVAVTVFAYFETVDHAFISLDDPSYVSANDEVKHGINRKSLAWAFTTGHADNWHPVTWLSHMIDYQLFGPDAGGHHLMNLLFHLANSVLLFLLLKKMTLSSWRSITVAALFALHPLHVESVAWVSERKDVLSTFLGLLTTLAYLRYVGKPSLKTYLVMVLLFALGLMAKPMLITLPFVFLLLDFWPLNRWGAVKGNLGLVYEKVPLLVLTAASSVITFLVQQAGGAVRTLEQFTLSERLANVPVSYVDYLEKMFWPRDLAVFYPHPESGFSLGWVLICLALLLACTFFFFKKRKSFPYLLTGWLWYVGTLVPVIGLVQVGLQAMADRYTYISLVGIFIMMVWFAADMVGEKQTGRGLLAAAGAVLVVAMIFFTRTQVSTWRDDGTLFDHAMKSTSDNYLARFHLGNYYLQGNNFSEAMKQFSEAVRIKPDGYQNHLHLGRALLKLKNYSDAETSLRKAVELQPGLAQSCSFLAIALLNQGKIPEAEEFLLKAVKIDPDHYLAQFNLGILRMNQGRFREAVESLETAVKIEPGNSRARQALEHARSRAR